MRKERRGKKVKERGNMGSTKNKNKGELGKEGVSQGYKETHLSISKISNVEWRQNLHNRPCCASHTHDSCSMVGGQF